MLDMKINILLLLSLISLSLFANMRSSDRLGELKKEINEKVEILEVKMKRIEQKISNIKQEKQEDFISKYNALETGLIVREWVKVRTSS
jgi:hypothetical protein